ncbi:O-antigen ligase family protein [Fibrobacterota bacterium]
MAFSRIVYYTSLPLITIGALSWTQAFTNQGALKILFLVAGLCFIHVAGLKHLRPGPGLGLAFIYFLYSYFHLQDGYGMDQTALSAVLMLLAFCLGYRRLFNHPVLWLSVLLVCSFKGLWDFFSMGHVSFQYSYGMVSSFFLHKNFWAFLIIPAVYWTLFTAQYGRKKNIRSVAALAVLMLISNMLLSDSRSAQGACCISMVLFFLVNCKVTLERPPINRLVFTGICSLAVGISPYLLSEPVYLRLANLFVSEAGGPGFRQWTWSAAWQAFLAAPFFGTGTGSFLSAAAGHLSPVTHTVMDPLRQAFRAHNHYLHLLVEKGIVGFFLEMILLTGAGWMLWRQYRISGNKMAGYGFYALLGMCIQSFFSVAVEFAVPKALFYGVMGYAWSFESRKENNAFNPSLILKASYGFMVVLAMLHGFGYIKTLAGDAYYVRAKQHMGDRNKKQYHQMLLKSLEWEPWHPETNYHYANVLAASGFYHEALQYLKRIDDRAPRHMPTPIMRSQVYLKMGQYDSAYQQAELIQKKYPYFPSTFLVMTRARAAQQRCGQVDSLQRYARRRMARWYSEVNLLSDKQLQNHLKENPNINNLQRLLGGKSLQRRYSWSVHEGLSRGASNYRGLKEILAVECGK